MKLINHIVELIKPSGYQIDDIYKSIEVAGRISYKSEDRMTDESYLKFFEMIKNNKHLTVTEFGTIYLTNNSRIPNLEKYKTNKYSRYKSIQKDNSIHEYVTTNMRVIIENDWFDDFYLLSEPTEFHDKRITFKITTSRGISHELVRHRVFSVVQESQRYCNYSKDKFNNEVTCIKPLWLDEPYQSYNFNLAGKIVNDNREIIRFNSLLNNEFIKQLCLAENSYIKLLSELKPQEARDVLLNATKTELIMIGFKDEWDSFLQLRMAKNAHPEMQVVANKINDYLK